MYIIADAAALPFEAATFDLVVAYNSLMDIEDMPGAVREAARVLELGGHLCLCLTHPMADAGTFVTEEADAPFVITGSYLSRRWREKTEERDGLQMTFRSWAYPLEGYARALEAAGFLIEAIREPVATPSAVAARPGYACWQRLPMFLHLRAVRP
jgi:ubiquinone/menaquinone biosynthesis C-methylase UbiE